MPQTRTFCPRCRQPITAEIDQLFDVSAEPQVKQRFLSGAFNLANCPHCGYQGNLATPIVYHDAAKELLLTYFPPELGLPVNEQERLVGPLINQVVNRLPNEQRKAYLLRPQSVLTLQGMMEKILEADGITKEMIQAQQQRLALIQQLLALPEESRVEIVKREEALIDESTFSILNRLIEAALGGGDEQAARQLAAIQQIFITHTAVGQRLQAEAEESQEAARALQEASKNGLTRESLLDLLLTTKSDTGLTTMASMARSGMDYAFFQILSDRIDQAPAGERERLEQVRSRLLEITQEIDQEIKQQTEQIHRLIEELLKAPDIEAATTSVMPAVSQLFVDILNGELQAARQKSDLERISKLQKVVSTLQKASAPPPEYELLEKLLGAEQEADRRQILEQNSAQVTEQFIGLISGLLSQTQNQDPELTQQLETVNRSVLRYSMEMNLKK
jgi:NTP pyrophosphatase (non-canonical NTP hydrolase)